MKNLLLLFCATICLAPVSAQSYIPEYNNSRIKVKTAFSPKAYAFNLRDVHLLNSPFRHALDMDSAYLLQIQPNRLLYRFYKNAGLPVKDSVYGGWESEGLSGHTLGHYLSACSMMYISTQNPEFRNRVDYLVNELARCQAARHSGYVGAIPNEDSIFGKVSSGIIKSGGFDLNGGWSPWYTVHKIMAGLCDAYLYCDNKQALGVVTKMADWAYNVVYHLNDSLRLRMLNCEYGGMNDVLVNIYAFTGNKKYLDLSRKFHDEFVLGKLAMRVDPMPGKHSNTNVPKAIGCAARFEFTGAESDSTIASFFWQTMVHQHTYVIGGNSNYEYCGEPGKLSERLSDNTCETCNTYNMLKLTRHLFAWNPDASYMDYYERALYNHILASQNPSNGMMCYFVPLRMGTRKSFSDSFNTFTCCVGSGMENHSKYAEQIYSHNGKEGLFVNLFIPSVLQWKSKAVVIRQDTDFPASANSNLTVQCARPVRLQICIRVPGWSGGGIQCSIRGSDGKLGKIQGRLMNNGYYMIDRVWKNNDRIECKLGMTLYTESMPDNPDRVAIKYGPLVLAGVLGNEKPDPVYGTPVLLTGNRAVSDWIKPISGKTLEFEMKSVGKPFDVKLIPFYQLYQDYYSVYWDFFTPANWAVRQRDYEIEKNRQKRIEEQTIDYFRVGEMQPERDHRLEASEKSYVSDALDVMGREARAGHYFAFDMKVNNGEATQLLLTYIGDDKDRIFDILVEGTAIAKVEWKGGKTGKFYNILYPLLPELVAGKEKVRIRIEANYGRTAGRIFGVRTLRGPVEDQK